MAFCMKNTKKEDPLVRDPSTEVAKCEVVKGGGSGGDMMVVEM